MLLFGFKLLYPDAVHLNRGNHESRSQTQTQGFMMEVLDKYRGPRGLELFNLFMVRRVCCLPRHSRDAPRQACFDRLPLCAVIKDKVFVVHGGLFERKGVRLTHLEALKRFKEIPLKRETFEDSLFQVGLLLV